jgi:hypothetical protein
LRISLKQEKSSSSSGVRLGVRFRAKAIGAKVLQTTGDRLSTGRAQEMQKVKERGKRAIAEIGESVTSE